MTKRNRASAHGCRDGRREVRIGTVAMLLSAAVACVAMAGWLYLEWTGNVGPSAALFGGAFLLYGSGMPALRMLKEPDGLSAMLHDVVSGSRWTPMRQQSAIMRFPRARAWLLPVALLPFMLVSLPIAFHTEPGDYSIIGVAFAYCAFFGWGAMLMGLAVWVLVVFPIMLIGHAVARRFGFASDVRSSRDDDRLAVPLSVVLMSTVVLAVSLAFAGPDAGGHGGHVSRLDVLALLFGLSDGRADHPALLWVARLAVVPLAVATFFASRAMHSGRRRRATSTSGIDVNV